MSGARGQTRGAGGTERALYWFMAQEAIVIQWVAVHGPPGASYDEVAMATPVFGSADEDILMEAAISGTGIHARYSSSVVVHVVVLHYSVACVEHAQVRHGEACVQRRDHAL